MVPKAEGEQRQGQGLGCAWITLAANTAVIGLLTSLFVQGPYHSSEQEFWYRYCSLGFFIAGVLLPAIAFIVVRRTHKAIAYLTAWMLIFLIGFLVFTMLSGGGM